MGLLIGLFLIVALAGCESHSHSTSPTSTGERTHVEELEYPLGGADLSSIKASTISGSIAVTGVSGTQGVLRVRKEVRADTKSEAEEFARLVRIHFFNDTATTEIYTTHPREPHGVSVVVSYDVECEKSTNLDLLTVNGGITVHNTAAGVRATTTNGGIEADLDLMDGEGRFAATNGRVDVRLERCIVPMTASTVNGAVDVKLPHRFSGLLNARTATGRIHCGIPLSEVVVRTERIISGRIGEGRDTPITIRCVNGSIRVGKF
jgi:DUF4097 and DUF4098 domain-containing protein YvlB